MKNIFHYILFACIVAGAFTSCSDPIEEDSVDPTIELKAVNSLISPANNTVIELSSDLKASENFEWTHSEASEGESPKYEIIFFLENETPAKPLYKIFANTKNSITINHIKLDEISAKAGIELGKRGTIKWTVRAYINTISEMSKDTKSIVIQRLKENKQITKLYLTGRGTEFGEDISEAMEFTKTSDTKYIIYSELIAGQPFNFINDIKGDEIRSFSLSNNKIVEDDGEAKINKSGIYKIDVDFSTGIVNMKEVTNISLYYCIKHQAIALQYTGRGIWETLSLIQFSKESWGDETRYKFKMSEGTVNKFLEKSDNGQFSMKESIITDHDKQLWDGVWGYSSNLKNRWAKVKVDMSNYSHNIEPVEEEFIYVGSWTNYADKSTSDFVKGYWNTSKRHFNNGLNGVINQYDYWPEAHAIDVIIDAYERSKDNKYKQIIYDFYEGVKSKNGNKFKNSFYDDMAWHGLAHLRAFEATEDVRYEESARNLWNWILEGWDNNNGGIKWNDQPNGTVPGVPSTGPATIIGVRRWVKYGSSEIINGLNDLEWAKKMYEWMRVARHDPATGGVYDDFVNKSGAWTYNTGTFLGSAMELYDVTREGHYLEDAIRTADWTIENLSIKTQNNYILSDWAEQVDNDVNLFKGIFIRYFTRLIMNPDLPSDKKEKYIRFIEYNAKVLLTYATDDENTMIYNYGWYFKPETSYLRGQTSGCTLIEALALLESKGFI